MLRIIVGEAMKFKHWCEEVAAVPEAAVVLL